MKAEVAVKKDEVTLAQEVIQERERKDIEAFMGGYNELCKNHGYSMSPVLTLKASGIEPSFEVVRNKKQ